MNDFREYLINNCNAKYGIVGNFSSAGEENFSDCNFYGIDGDKLKDDNYNNYYSYVPKSCDVIKCLDNQLDFIEFKTLNISEISNINTKINQFELTKKLEGTYDLLKKIIDMSRLDNNLIIDIQKQFIISIYLVDFNPNNRFILSSRIQIIKRNLEGYFNNNPMPYGENFLVPKFIKTEEINNCYT